MSDEEIYNGETAPLLNLTSWSDKHITFKVFETLKGEPNKTVDVILERCFGVTSFGETALLFKVKDVWHIKSDNKGTLAKNVLKQLSTVDHEADIISRP